MLVGNPIPILGIANMEAMIAHRPGKFYLNKKIEDLQSEFAAAMLQSDDLQNRCAIECTEQTSRQFTE